MSRVSTLYAQNKATPNVGRLFPSLSQSKLVNVVYFDQQIGASQVVCWLKSTFLVFIHVFALSSFYPFVMEKD